ncbi:hypothetical protein LI90_3971 [Carbonactinospora thermoautotrophica]|uniref:Uncharacterized protein n=1 Tax=Carbonactinospora thermoautotrophica TaxID=1469144 RepID=A0A132MZZ9_9ACTN|nr:hypothetical protein LI90_3971 [Carbonactinospora thermoautotrophica]
MKSRRVRAMVPSLPYGRSWVRMVPAARVPRSKERSGEPGFSGPTLGRFKTPRALRLPDSPPRAWGGRQVPAKRSRVRRLTPTCVGRTQRRTARLVGGRTHPHVRGEDLTSSDIATDSADSPPRAWGGQARVGQALNRSGLTPTCVGRTRTFPLSRRGEMTHPHVRGEDAMRQVELPDGTDSPPRAWGGRPAAGPPAQRPRLTPTCVGRTRGPRFPPWSGATHPHVRGEDGAPGGGRQSSGDSPPRAWGGPRAVRWRRGRGRTHPHVRGEDTRTPKPDNLAHDSPPRAWGGRLLRLLLGLEARLTPTCVGRTPTRGRNVAGIATHPHVRGEDPNVPPLAPGRNDSPPRAWGGRRRCGGCAPSRGLTPTCVGRTRTRPPFVWSRPTHPHVRGEDRGQRCRRRHYGDSPPRAWGGPGHRRSGIGWERLTPTCVGRTAFSQPSPYRWATHPHVRGEDSTKGARTIMANDSPPRAWGGQARVVVPALARRLTPTCVGRTVAPFAKKRSLWTHPHVRGEDSLRITPVRERDDSPPRAWGGHPGHSAARQGLGLTPTCVGRTGGRGPAVGSAGTHPHVRGEDSFR